MKSNTIAGSKNRMSRHFETNIFQDKEETVTILSKEYNRLLQQEIQLYRLQEKFEVSQTTCSQKSSEIKKLKSLLFYYKQKEAISKEAINSNREYNDRENTENDGEDAVTNVN